MGLPELRSNFVIEGSISSATATTDANGNASANWTLGDTEGTQTLTVSAFKADGTTALVGSPISVAATAEPEPLVATSLELVSGDGQSAEIETLLEDPVVVIVKDQHGDPISGIAVNFAIVDPVSAGSEYSQASGEVSISWILGTTEGEQTLTITAFEEDGTTPLSGSPLSVTAIGEAPLAIGDFHKGGVVFYIDETGDHGLVCAIADAAYNKEAWGCKGTLVGADGITVGTGIQNTATIESECAGINAAWASTHVSFGIDEDYYEDYFLSSSGELSLIWQNRELLDAKAIANGGKAFEKGNYWSSTEADENGDDYAAALSFNNEGWSSDSKDIENNVRPIRAF